MPTAGDELLIEKVLKNIGQILNDIEAEAEPSKEIVACGEALVKIGKELEGFSLNDARKIMRAVSAMVLD